MLDGAIELVEKGRAGRTRSFRERQERCLTGPWPGCMVFRMAREHEAVGDEGVLAGCEELREANVCRGAVGVCALEYVVLRHHTTGWEAAPGLGNSLHGPT